MTQYVIQIKIDNGWLAKSFEVTEECPIPSSVPAGREPIIMTNTASFDGIVAAYSQHTTALVFSYDEQAETISCSGPYEHTWDIN